MVRFHRLRFIDRSEMVIVLKIEKKCKLFFFESLLNVDSRLILY